MNAHSAASTPRPLDPAGRPTAPGRRRPPGLPWWQAAAAGAAVAAAVNLLIFAGARLAGADLVLDASRARPYPITAGGVLFSSVVPMVAGIALAALLSLLWSGFLRVAQVTGALLAVATLAGPLTSEADGGTVAALTAMHLVSGVVVVAALEAVRRHRRGRPA
ncbi:MAG TPA: DUF6069 family protein [Pilimelia sp.]|nr:DUF6069 family protein [Pilimelia sp.]